MAKQQKDTGLPPFDPEGNDGFITDAPDKLPDGLERIQVPATVAEGSGKDRVTKKVTLSLIAPTRSNGGVIAYQKYREANGATDGDTFVADCIRSAVRSQTVPALSPDTHGESERYLPSAPNTRTVDSAAAAGDKITDFIREHGRGPSQDELAEIYASLGVSA